MSELLPCPFCGGGADLWFNQMYIASCTQCKTMGHPQNAATDATATWNCRASGWISVEERLPETNKAVLFVIAPDAVVSGWYDELTTRWFSIQGVDFTEYVTHWMELPPPPARRAIAQGD